MNKRSEYERRGPVDGASQEVHYSHQAICRSLALRGLTSNCISCSLGTPIISSYVRSWLLTNSGDASLQKQPFGNKEELLFVPSFCIGVCCRSAGDNFHGESALGQPGVCV
ncbi:hypothetical protein EVAR_30672_1 [Eumeta japonica]|uniref:Uncharacterized protein n=1 Tax=Eumeta variegata TaxID=151549 RepID=A0A4C1VTS7_EUMVA|nr:hypothetical protein EVAR_30672_1 [Eumeta japonica]